MYSYTHIVEASNKDLKTLWNKYVSVETWNEWDSSIISSSLNGEFKQGISGVLVNHGMSPLEFELTEVVPLESFSNRSNIGPFTITFTHKASQNEGLLRIEHGIIVTGPDSLKVDEIGSNISKTIPDAMSNLLGLI